MDGERASESPARPLDEWFAHPLLSSVAAHRDAFLACCRGELVAALPGPRPLRFALQTPDLLADGLHYEQRIARGVIATRDASTHDAFNALVWLAHRTIKEAMNARQVADIARVGQKLRTRGQCALTHFDEAGAIVWIDGDDLVDAWNAHDWHTLFATHRGAWGSRIASTVIGHALFDYAFAHDELPVAKALAVRADRNEIEALSKRAAIAAWPEAEQRVADAIARGRLLADPQELRPLPLAGVPGWHRQSMSPAFFSTMPCFRPLRPGRCYPEPAKLGDRNVRNVCERRAARAADRPAEPSSR
jgi:DUF3025 family protein